MNKLWQVKFDAAHPDEFTGCTIIQSSTEPTEQLCVELIATHGAVYIEKITEVTEKEIRYITPKRVIYLDK